MNLAVAIIPLIIVVLVSAIVVRIAAIMLKMTGLDTKTAKFQSLSAFTGTGFTTKDSEQVIRNEVRRKIITVLMILGNAGIVTVITTLVISFVRGGAGSITIKMIFIILGLLGVYRLTSHKGITRWLNRVIENKIASTKILEKRPVEHIYDLPKGHGIYGLNITEEFQQGGKSLGEAGLTKKGIIVLSIEKKDRMISSPKASDKIEIGDKILCYGSLKNIESCLTLTG